MLIKMSADELAEVLRKIFPGADFSISIDESFSAYRKRNKINKMEESDYLKLHKAVLQIINDEIHI